MGLKITKEIGTDKGITSEAYVRIADYRVSKYKNAVFMLEIFMKQSDAEGFVSPVPINDITAKNAEIGQMIYLVLEDFTEIEAGSIFEYGYAKLKDKLVGIYGAEYVIDC
jgi:hypothetical protein